MVQGNLTDKNTLAIRKTTTHERNKRLPGAVEI